MLAWHFMKRKIVVEKEKFDAVLSQLLRTKPIPMKKVKTQGRKGPKAPLFQKQSES